MYSIHQTEIITGINAHTLRKWESRYSFIKPQRSKSNIRFYTEDDIRNLLNINLLVSMGVKLSKIDHLTKAEIEDKIKENLESSNGSIENLINHTLDFNEIEFERILDENISQLGMEQCIIHFIYPFLNRVGILWGINTVLPAEEHFVTSIITRKILAHIESLPIPDQDSRKMLMFLPPQEYHEIGLLLAYYIVLNAGWRVVYLGANVPNENIKSLINKVHPDVIFTMFTLPDYHSIESNLNYYKNLNTPIWVSGNTQITEGLISKEHNMILKEPSELLKAINQFKARNSIEISN